MDFTHFQSWSISVLITNYYYIDYIYSIYRFKYVLEIYGDFGAFWGAELHRRIRCLAMDGYLPTVRLRLTFHKIDLWVRFPIPPIGGHSASCSRSYARFTEECSVFLVRGSCRGDEGLSIDFKALVSVDSDDRIWPEHILWPTEAHK